ncbi:MAG: hypothetical protein JNG84_04010 [Archangium sp.]|nr:hypothetical protein [Archangium sp.]
MRVGGRFLMSVGVVACLSCTSSGSADASFACRTSSECAEGFACGLGTCVPLSRFTPDGGLLGEDGGLLELLRAAPTRGPVGTLVTLTGVELSKSAVIDVGGARALVVGRNAGGLLVMVMPGSASGALTATERGTTFSTAEGFVVTPTGVPAMGGPKLVGTGASGPSSQGISVALSAGGDTALVGGWNDDGNAGAAWVWAKTDGGWSQQGPKLVGSGASGPASQQGRAVALSADGNTALVGGLYDVPNIGTGAAWVFTRREGVWSQQGEKLVPIDSSFHAVAFGGALALSADGDTALISGAGDMNPRGSAWIFTRTDGVWSQQGKLFNDDGTSTYFGSSVALSADGTTALIGSHGDLGYRGGAWVWVKTAQGWRVQGPKLTFSPPVEGVVFGFSTALSADGNTAAVGAYRDDNNTGSVVVFTRTGEAWAQQGAKLVASDATPGANQGSGVALSADGTTLLLGAENDSGGTGAAWIFVREAGAWTQRAKLVGADGLGVRQGYGVALSADGRTAVSGGRADNGGVGATWVFTAP